MRSPVELINQVPVCPSQNKKYGARELLLDEIQELKNDFINAAIRAKKSGYDGVEIHGAHGYILTQFLSKEINKRSDQYGGNLENRSRLLFEIINGVRNSCGSNFLLGVRLSPEKFDMNIPETKEICKRLIEDDIIDFIDISLWDIFKLPEEEKFRSKSLLNHFTEIDFKKVLLTVAGNIRNGDDVKKALDSGVDFLTIGRSAILHHNFPVKVIENPNFESREIPVSKEYLMKEGLGENFINYMRRWPNFVKTES